MLCSECKSECDREEVDIGVGTQNSASSPAERSLLLFFESCCVEHGGLVDVRRMNQQDFETARRWSGLDFVKFGRVAADDIVSSHGYNGTHWCWLSDTAWGIAHAERLARARRLWDSRSWTKTCELGA